MKKSTKPVQFEPPKFVSENDTSKDGKTRPNFPVWTVIDNQRWEITSVEKGIVNLESSCTKQVKLLGLKIQAHFRDKAALADFIAAIKKEKNYHEIE